MSEWLVCRGVCYGYTDKWVIRDLDLAVDGDARVVAVVGPSGVGKTTLVGLLAGLFAPAAGTIEVNGAPVSGPDASRPVVFQDHCLFPWMTVLENVAFGLKCRGVPRKEREARSRDLLSGLRLEGTEGLYPKELSGGMKQRIGVARALAVSPRLLLMDEPFNALDTEAKLLLLGQATQLAGTKETRLVVVTHDLRDAAFLADRVVIMRERGQVATHRVADSPHPRPVDRLFSQDVSRERDRLRAALLYGEEC